jgi:hypothetical protein
MIEVIRRLSFLYKRNTPFYCKYLGPSSAYDPGWVLTAEWLANYADRQSNTKVSSTRQLLFVDLR